MKKVKLIFLSFILALVGVAFALPSAFCESVKAETQEVTINSANELASYLSAPSNYSLSYKLGRNIDMSTVSEEEMQKVWTAQTTAIFTGTFDGDGYAINNLTISSQHVDRYYGLFAKAEGARFKNLKVGGSVEYVLAGGSPTIGTLVGYGNNVTFEYCEVGEILEGENTTIATQKQNKDFTVTTAVFTYGGFAGELIGGSKILNCASYINANFNSQTTIDSTVRAGGSYSQ